MIAQGAEILEFIPQRPPFVMVDTLVESNETKTVSSFTIPTDNPMVSEQVFQEGGILENIAQTAACGVGYQCKISETEVPVGFIGAIKKINIFELPVVGNTISTTVRVSANVMNASIISAEVLCDGIVLATCDMNIFLK